MLLEGATAFSYYLKGHFIDEFRNPDIDHDIEFIFNFDCCKENN